MKNFVQPGHIVDLTAPAGGLASGQAHLFGGLFGVATTAALAGAKVAVSVEGIFNLPKDNAGIAEGQKVYWNGAAVTATADTNTFIGHAIADALATDTTATVRLVN